MKHKDSIGNDKSKGYLNKGEEDEMEIWGFKEHRPYKILTTIGIILTFGFLRLIFHWWPKLMLHATNISCPFASATKLLIVDTFEQRFKSVFVENVQVIKEISQVPNETPMEKMFTIHLYDGTVKEVTEIRIVVVKKLTYVWVEEKALFIKLSGLDNGLSHETFFNYQGYTEAEEKRKQLAYGKNEIEVPIQTIPVLIILELLNPFCIFQVFALILWWFESYYYYSIAIILMSGFGIASSVVQTHMNQKKLYNTINSTDVVTVRRSKDIYENVETTNLVPGDVFVIPPKGCIINCDAILLNGSCIVNESMLTGESVPVTKTYLPQTNQIYNSKEDSHYTLFCGTKVIQTRCYASEKVHALVIRTGFLTAKGNLVRSILYPPPADFRFEQESYKFMRLLAFFGLLGFIYTVVVKTLSGRALVEIILKSLDLLTIAIPVALPGAITVGKICALGRLKNKKISCINSRVINVAGSLNCTLTEDGLDMWGVIPVVDRAFAEHYPNPKLVNQQLLHGMTTCHSLALIDGEICGDPLDIKMFESTGWTIHEPEIPDESKYDLLVPTVVRAPGKDNEVEIGLLHHFNFSSNLQRMSVLTRKLGSQEVILYCKGSPEIISSLSIPNTVPPDLNAKLEQYTEKGYRVIAVGWKVLKNFSYHKLDKLKREEVENDLNMSGLIVLENRLKPQTIPTIEKLQKADFKLAMITGDHVQTAVSVAKECGLISKYDRTVEIKQKENYKTNQFIFTRIDLDGKDNEMIQLTEDCLLDNFKIATTGKVWESLKMHRPDLLYNLVSKGIVFARVSSLQKQEIIIELQNLGYVVGMCGDGANDCGALKAAHVGVSLSEAEASVASPFTSQKTDISCILDVIIEGRAALVTSLGLFKFMILYSFIQFISTMYLYEFDSNLTDFQFLFIDICLVINFAFFFGRCEAYKGEIVARSPLPSLLTTPAIASLLLQILTVLSIQISSNEIVGQYSWFETFNLSYGHYASYQNYAIYTVSQFQYITLAFIFSQGAPYREPIYTNVCLFSSIIFMTLVSMYITLFPADWIITLLDIKFPPSSEFPIVVIFLGLTHFLVSLFFESFIVNHVLANYFQNKNKIKAKSNGTV